MASPGNARGTVRFLLDGAVVALDAVDPHAHRARVPARGPRPHRHQGRLRRRRLRRVHGRRRRARGRAASGSAPINACIRFVPTLDGKALFTVESLAGRDGALHPVQQAMVDCHGSQCGFCTPGFVMSLFALYKSAASPSRAGHRRRAGRQPVPLHRLSADRRCGAAHVRLRPRGDAGDVARPRVRRGRGRRARRRRARRLRRSCARSSAREHACDRARRTHVSTRPRTRRGARGAARRRSPARASLAGGTDVGLWVTKQLRELGAVIYAGDVAELQRIDGDRRRARHRRRRAAHRRLRRDRRANIRELAELCAALRVAADPQRRHARRQRRQRLADRRLDAGADRARRDARAAARRAHARAAARRVLPRLPEDGARGRRVRRARRACRARRRGAMVRAYKISKRFDQDISAVCGGFRSTSTAAWSRAARIGYGGVAAMPKRALAAERALVGKPWSDDDRARRDGRARPRLRAARRHARERRLSPHGRAQPAAALLPRDRRAHAPRHPRARGRGHAHDARRHRAHAAASAPRCRTTAAACTSRGEARLHRRHPRAARHAARGDRHERARARAHRRDRPRRGRAAPGVVAVVTAEDIPGVNDVGPIVADDPIFATTLVQYRGQSLFAVAATHGRGRRAAPRGSRVVEYEDAAGDPHRRGGARGASRSCCPPSGSCAAIARARSLRAPHRLRGTRRASAARITSTSKARSRSRCRARTAACTSTARRSIRAKCSTWWRTRSALAAHDVVVECRRMGGGFGGKETQPALFACVAALLARKTGRPVKLRLDRDDDMLIDRQAPRFRRRLRRRLRRRRPHPRRSTSRSPRAAATRPTCPARSTTARCSTSTTLLPRERRHRLAIRCKTQHRVEHGVPRLRRPAGHGRHRARDRRHRARARPRSARRAPAQLLRHRRRATSRPTA